jgi:hemoglobin
VNGNDTLFSRVGGEAWFVALVDRFYEMVETDPVLRPLYPEDLAPGRAHLAAFLAQYWGGPANYTAERGHPRLRQRHFPFAIGSAERDTWVSHMTAAVRAGGLSPGDEHEILDYFEMAATSLVNQAAAED